MVNSFVNGVEFEFSENFVSLFSYYYYEVDDVVGIIGEFFM